jgi:DNA-directed RNA polymerase specialized sigma24 family protein
LRNNYIKNKDFHALLKEYFSTKSRKAYNEIGKNFVLIAKNYLNKPMFINYSEDRKEEMVSDAVYIMTKYMKNYDPEKYNNPLAYFTSFAHNANLQLIKKYKKRSDMFVSLDLTENVDYSNSTTAIGE